jgi:hypothetical protein
MNAGRVAALALLAFQCACIQRARAQTPGPDGSLAAKPPVVLDSSACAAVPEAELRDLVALELAPRRLAAPGQLPAELRTTQASITCSENQARLRVLDSSLGRRQELELDLEETMAPARTRLLALTLSELIATLDMEVFQPADRSEADERAAEPPGTRTPQNDWHGHVWLGLGLAREGRPALLAPALHGGFAWYSAQLPLALQVDVLASRGRRTVAEGSLTAWTLAGSAALLARFASAWLDVLLGGGLRLGYARLEGTTGSQAGTLSAGPLAGVWWGPLLSGSLLIHLHGRWGLRTALELAYVAKPVRGLDSQGAPAYALERLQLHALLALTVGFR